MPLPMFGRVLFVINIPEKLKEWAFDLQSDTMHPEEEEVLLCPNVGLIVTALGTGDDATVDHVITLQMQYACAC